MIRSRQCYMCNGSEKEQILKEEPCSSCMEVELSKTHNETLNICSECHNKGFVRILRPTGRICGFCNVRS